MTLYAIRNSDKVPFLLPRVIQEGRRRAGPSSAHRVLRCPSPHLPLRDDGQVAERPFDNVTVVGVAQVEGHLRTAGQALNHVGIRPRAAVDVQGGEPWPLLPAV